MKSRHFFLASTVITAALISGCDGGGNGSQTGPIQTVSQFIASLIRLVTGTACDTASPVPLDGFVLTDDTTAVDANTLTVNCPT